MSCFPETAKAEQKRRVDVQIGFRYVGLASDPGSGFLGAQLPRPTNPRLLNLNTRPRRL